jgi:hypothetical protein
LRGDSTYEDAVDLGALERADIDSAISEITVVLPSRRPKVAMAVAINS